MCFPRRVLPGAALKRGENCEPRTGQPPTPVSADVHAGQAHLLFLPRAGLVDSRGFGHLHGHDLFERPIVVDFVDVANAALLASMKRRPGRPGAPVVRAQAAAIQKGQDRLLRSEQTASGRSRRPRPAKTAPPSDLVSWAIR